jgi:hypothetical protein
MNNLLANILDAGEEWPGCIEDVRSCIPEYLRPKTFPKTMNFMDPMVLARELERTGLVGVPPASIHTLATLLSVVWTAAKSQRRSG